MSRLNNLSARLAVNAWLRRTGRGPLPGHWPYVQFASELRKVVADGQVHVPFVLRSDAVRYVRHVAQQYAEAAE